jgi:hypothetical protein
VDTGLPALVCLPGGVGPGPCACALKLDRSPATSEPPPQRKRPHRPQPSIKWTDADPGAQEDPPTPSSSKALVGRRNSQLFDHPARQQPPRPYCTRQAGLDRSRSTLQNARGPRLGPPTQAHPKAGAWRGGRGTHTVAGGWAGRQRTLTTQAAVRRSGSTRHAPRSHTRSAATAEHVQRTHWARHTHAHTHDPPH